MHRLTEDHYFRPESVFYHNGWFVIVASDGWCDWLRLFPVDTLVTVGEEWTDADV